jgi:hypothetical protein
LLPSTLGKLTIVVIQDEVDVHVGHAIGGENDIGFYAIKEVKKAKMTRKGHSIWALSSSDLTAFRGLSGQRKVDLPFPSSSN